MRRRPTIRIQLLALALAASVPLAGAVAYVIFDASRARLNQAEGEIRNLVASTANDVAAALAESEELLSILAQRPLVRALDPRRCDPIVAEFVKLHPDFANLGARTLRGDSVCSFLPNVAAANVVVDFPWFQEGIRSRQFTVGDAFRGSGSGRWVSVLTVPLLDDRGAVIGVLGLPLDLLKLQSRILPAVPDNTLVSVIDRQGKFLMRSLGPDQWIGKSVQNPENVREARRRVEGTYRVAGVDGIARVFAYRTVAPFGWLVSVGIPEDTLLAPVRRHLAGAVAVVLVTLLFALVLVRRITAAIAKPIRDLEATTEKVARGDLQARASIEGPAELANVAREFNRMLDVRERAEAALRHSEQRFRLAASTGHVWDVNIAAGELFIPPQWKRSLGYEEHEVENTVAGWTALLHADDREPVARAIRDHYERRIPYDMEYRCRTKAGDYRWFHTKGQAMWDESGRATYMAGAVVDVTERKVAELRIKNLNRIYAVLSRIDALIVRVRDREELFREACRVAIEAGQFRMAWIGLVDRDAMRVKPVAWDGDVRDFFDSAPPTVMETRPGGHGLAGRAVREKRAVISNDVHNDPQRVLKKDLEERGINSLAVIPLLVDDDAVGVLALYAADKDFFSDEEMKLLTELAGDISFALDHIEKAERLDYFAYYDALTALANRTLFNERLTQQLKIAGQEQGRLALVLLDIERFKAVNDSLGRQAGDELLRQIAKRLVRFVGDSSRVGRLSADHYAVMLPAVRHEDEVARFVDEQSRSCFGEPFRLGRDADLRISVKAGVALSPEDGSDAETLQRNAEAALEKAKASGEKLLFYAPHMTARVAEKLALENKLRLALERDEFVLHYQPKVDLETRRIEGVEALIRWQSPELGLVPPLRFIPLMEETGMILEVGAWAMRRAALDHRHWLGQGAAAPRIAVNVSSIQLRMRDFVQTVRTALAEGVEPTGIDLEITESLIMEDIEENIEKLAAVRDMGVRIAVDDFGTGYSSLRYLAKLPVQTVKIDRSFIITMLDDANAMTVVSTIISLVHSLRLKVVAEGVESEEQAKILHLLKCDEMQGYLISRPVPQEDLLALLVSGKFAAPRAPR